MADNEQSKRYDEMIVKEIDERRALRALSDKPVSREIIDRLLTAATYAPSFGNNQPWRFLVLEDEESMETVRKRLPGGNYWARPCPAVIAVVTREDLDGQMPGNRNYALFDTGMACMNLQLQARKEGLVAHPVAGFNAIELRRDLGIDEDYILIALMFLAYPGPEDTLSEKHLAMEKGPRNRKALSEVVFYKKWEN